MGFVNESLILVVGAKTGVNAVVVGGGIAVIGVVPGTLGGVVLKHGCEPQGGHSQIVEIVEMLAYAFQVTAVAVTWVIAVAHLAAHPAHLVVGGVAVGKAVGHEHIEHIGIRETLLAAVAARLEDEGHGLFLLLELEVEVHGAWLHPVQTHANDEVVGALQLCDAVDGHPGIVGGDGGGTDALAIDHDFERVVFESCIPVLRLNPVDIELGSLRGKSHEKHSG